LFFSDNTASGQRHLFWNTKNSSVTEKYIGK
jgi:hypothetical protein